MNRFCLFFILAFLSPAYSPAEKGVPSAGEVDGVPFVELHHERLSDLKVPRTAHTCLSLGEEIVVIGGHTTGFVPTATAEYYSDGTWHTVPMLYAHDDCFSIVLPDGRIMVGGGHVNGFGVGGGYGVEIYDPSTHQFTPVGILDRERSLASAAAFPDGRVLVSGNWYGEDNLAMCTPGGAFVPISPVSEERAYPFLLPVSETDALIFGPIDNYGNPTACMVDRLEGAPFVPELLQEWRPKANIFCSESYSIGGGMFLIPVFRGTSCAVMKVSGLDFSLLSTDCPIPVVTPDGEAIEWSGHLMTDHATRMAYMPGKDSRSRFHLLRIHYDPSLVGGTAAIRVFSTRDSIDGLPAVFYPVLLAGGRVVLSGGIINDNFTPLSTVFQFDTDIAPQRGKLSLWLFLSFIVAGGIILVRSLQRIKQQDGPSGPAGTESFPTETKPDMMTRIEQLMMQQQLFLQKDLRVSDVAKALGTNSTYVSACINGQWGGSFTELVTQYRIGYAKELMQSHPDMLMETVADQSGFFSESSFYRAFKARTGLTPTEWKQH